MLGCRSTVRMLMATHLFTSRAPTGICRRLTDGSSNNVAEYVALLLCLDQLVETKRRERARTETNNRVELEIDGPGVDCELPGQSLSDASAVEQGSPTEPQDEVVDVDVDVDGDDDEEDGDDEEQDEEEDEDAGNGDDGKEDGERKTTTGART